MWEEGSSGKTNPPKSWKRADDVDAITLSDINEANDNFGAHAEELVERSQKLNHMDPQRLANLTSDYERFREENNLAGMRETSVKIQQHGKKVAEILGMSYSLDVFFEQIMNTIRYIGVALRDVSYYLLGLLILLEGLSLLIENPADFPIGKLMVIFVRYALLKFLIRFWFYIMSIIKMDIKQIAALATRERFSPTAFQPQKIFDTLAYPVVDSFNLLNITNVIWAIILSIAFIIIMLISIEFFMAELERVYTN